VNTGASIGGNAQVSAGDGITVSADDTIEIFSAAGGLAASTGNAGVGIGIDVGVLTRHTVATVGAGADLQAGGHMVGAPSQDEVRARVRAINASRAADGGDR
jgi:hypothetical protein